MYDEGNTIEILKLVSGKGTPVRGLPLLKDTVGEQKTFLVFSNQAHPMVSNFKMKKERYENFLNVMLKGFRKSGSFTEMLVLKTEGPDEKKFLRFDMDFQRRLTDIEIQAIELVLHSCFGHEALWVWGRHIAGKTRLMILQTPELWDKDNETSETFMRLLYNADFEFNIRHNLVYFDIWMDKRGTSTSRHFESQLQ